MLRARHPRFRLAALLSVGLLAALVAGLAQAADLGRGLELDTVDARFDVRGTQQPSGEVVAVHVDDVTLGELQRRWPFPRSYHARLIDRLRRGRRARDRDGYPLHRADRRREDNALISAIADARGRVVLADHRGRRRRQHERARRRRRCPGRRGAHRHGAPPAGLGRGRAPLPVRRRRAGELRGRGRRALPAIAKSTGARSTGGDAWIDFAGPPDTDACLLLLARPERRRARTRRSRAGSSSSAPRRRA